MPHLLIPSQPLSTIKNAPPNHREEETTESKKTTMKRPSSPLESDDPNPPKIPRTQQNQEEVISPPLPADLGDDLILEILKLADAKTLARAACVSHRWRALVEDERIWEALCTRHVAGVGCGPRQLRSVVMALGGFKKLHSIYLRPLLQPAHVPRRGWGRVGHLTGERWGRDEVHLSMALLSIGFFERMSK